MSGLKISTNTFKLLYESRYLLEDTLFLRKILRIEWTHLRKNCI